MIRRPQPLRPETAAARRPAAWGWLGGAAGALLSLLMFAPASWLARAIHDASGEKIFLADPSGTVWRGSARLVLKGGAGSHDAVALPGRVQWTLNPAWTGLAASLLTECCTRQPVQMRIIPRFGGWRLDIADSQAEWPAGLLSGLGTPWNTLQPTGQLSLRSTGLSAQWNDGRLVIKGNAVLEARDIESRLSTLHPVGSYRLQLAGGPTTTLDLSTTDGGLQLRGNGQWVGSRLRFTGEASAAPGREAALANLLNIIGRRDGLRSIITIG